jgi:hypothetical protein
MPPRRRRGAKSYQEFQKAKLAELRADKEVMASLSHLSAKQLTPELSRRVGKLWDEHKEASGMKEKVNLRVLEGVRLVPFAEVVWVPPGAVAGPESVGAGAPSPRPLVPRPSSGSPSSRATKAGYDVLLWEGYGR